MCQNWALHSFQLRITSCSAQFRARDKKTAKLSMPQQECFTNWPNRVDCSENEKSGPKPPFWKAQFLKLEHKIWSVSAHLPKHEDLSWTLTSQFWACQLGPKDLEGHSRSGSSWDKVGTWQLSNLIKFYPEKVAFQHAISIFRGLPVKLI